MNVRPLHDVLLIDIEQEKKVSSGGIILPDSSREPIRIGKVVAAGPGRSWKVRDGKKTFWPMQAEAGDRVAFFMANLETKQGYQLCHVLGEGHGLIRETDVLFVIPEGENIEVTS
jgi:chaperonin GroES